MNKEAQKMGNLSWLKRKGPEEYKRLEEIGKIAAKVKVDNAIKKYISYLEGKGYKVTKI